MSPLVSASAPAAAEEGAVPAPSSAAAAVEMCGLRKAYGRRVALHDLSLHLLLPGDVSAESGSFPDGSTEIPAPGEQRLFSVSLRSARLGSFPIQVLATFTLPDGRSFQTRQGATLEVGAAARPGRSHAGAYEVMGVPIDEPGR